MKLHPQCRTCRCDQGFYGQEVCAWCENEFIKTAVDQKFCGHICRQQYSFWMLRQKVEAQGRVWEDRT